MEREAWFRRHRVEVGSIPSASSTTMALITFNSKFLSYNFGDSLPPHLSMDDLDDKYSDFLYDSSDTRTERRAYDVSHLPIDDLSNTLSKLLDLEHDHDWVQGVVDDIVIKVGDKDDDDKMMMMMTLEVDMQTLVCSAVDVISSDHDYDYEYECEYDYDIIPAEIVHEQPPAPVTPTCDDYVIELLKKRKVRVAAAAAAEEEEGVQGERNSRKKMKNNEELVRRVVRESDSCGVCLEEFVKGKDVYKLECEHAFHRGCMIEWLERSHFCPLCRFEMPAAGQTYINSSTLLV